MKVFDIPTIRFTGGEPLLHSQFLDMLKLAKKKGFFVIVNTNATIAFDKYILEILENCVDMILVSIQGYSEESDELITNTRNLWKTKIDNIQKLLNSKMKYVVLGTVITRQLIDHWQRYHALVKRIGIKHWVFFRPMVSPEDSIYSLNRKVFLHFIGILYKYKTEKMNLRILGPFPFCMGEDIRKMASVLEGGSHSSGHAKLVWDANGYFKPSYFINIRLGTTLSKALNHRYMCGLSNRDSIPFCKRCVFFSRCLGGSRFWAEKAYGNYFAPDPLVSQKNSLFLKT